MQITKVDYVCTTCSGNGYKKMEEGLYKSNAILLRIFNISNKVQPDSYDYYVDIDSIKTPLDLVRLELLFHKYRRLFTPSGVGGMNLRIDKNIEAYIRKCIKKKILLKVKRDYDDNVGDLYLDTSTIQLMTGLPETMSLFKLKKSALIEKRNRLQTIQTLVEKLESLPQKDLAVLEVLISEYENKQNSTQMIADMTVFLTQLKSGSMPIEETYLYQKQQEDIKRAKNLHL
ncbi:MAG: hypothetical protein PHN72_06615 [Bacilli bacterium]|nr:hypothetical protein [Bacilli bacterium]